jgi:hypothetical protein
VIHLEAAFLEHFLEIAIPAFEIVLRLAFKFFGNRIQNHETALQQIGAPFHHPNLKSALTENFATRPPADYAGKFSAKMTSNGKVRFGAAARMPMIEETISSMTARANASIGKQRKQLITPSISAGRVASVRSLQTTTGRWPLL